MNRILYNYDRYGKTVSQTEFMPSHNNWFISAQSNDKAYYFTNLSSFKNWSSTCCGESRDAIFDGKLREYTIEYNRPRF